MNNIKEIKKFINENGNNEGCLDNFIDAHYDEFEDIDFKYVETLESDEYRWYITSTVVYEVYKNNMILGHLAISEVTTIKIGMLSYSDLYFNIEAFNVKEIIKKSFEIVESEE